MLSFVSLLSLCLSVRSLPLSLIFLSVVLFLSFSPSLRTPLNILTRVVIRVACEGTECTQCRNTCPCERTVLTSHRHVTHGFCNSVSANAAILSYAAFRMLLWELISAASLLPVPHRIWWCIVLFFCLDHFSSCHIHIAPCRGYILLSVLALVHQSNFWPANWSSNAIEFRFFFFFFFACVLALDIVFARSRFALHNHGCRVSSSSHCVLFFSALITQRIAQRRAQSFDDRVDAIEHARLRTSELDSAFSAAHDAPVPSRKHIAAACTNLAAAAGQLRALTSRRTCAHCHRDAPAGANVKCAVTCLSAQAFALGAQVDLDLASRARANIQAADALAASIRVNASDDASFEVRAQLHHALARVRGDTLAATRAESRACAARGHLAARRQCAPARARAKRGEWRHSFVPCCSSKGNNAS